SLSLVGAPQSWGRSGREVGAALRRVRGESAGGGELRVRLRVRLVPGLAVGEVEAPAASGEGDRGHPLLDPLEDLPVGDAVVRLDLSLAEQRDESAGEGDYAVTLLRHQTLTF